MTGDGDGHLCSAELLMQLACACAAAGVVHTNISPANLLLTAATPPQIRLIDVGATCSPAAPQCHKRCICLAAVRSAA